VENEGTFLKEIGDANHRRRLRKFRDHCACYLLLPCRVSYSAGHRTHHEGGVGMNVRTINYVIIFFYTVFLVTLNAMITWIIYAHDELELWHVFAQVSSICFSEAIVWSYFTAKPSHEENCDDK
jgi:hypothetical protein